MKKVFRAILFGLMGFALSACGTDNPETSVTSTSEQTASETESASSAATEDQEEVENAVRRISVQFGENVVIYELNGGTAAHRFMSSCPLPSRWKISVPMRKSFTRRRSWIPVIPRWRRPVPERWPTMNPGAT